MVRFLGSITWYGKFLLLDQTLDLLNAGGLYIVDDLLPQKTWPKGHHIKVKEFLDHIEKRQDLFILQWPLATGLLVAIKK